MRERVAVITGANSFLAAILAERLMTDLPSEDKLTIVLTSRTFPGVKQPIFRLRQYLEKHPRQGLTFFDYLVFDQSSMVSMLDAAKQLQQRFKHIDYVFLNASGSHFVGIDYVQAAKEFFIRPVRAFTEGTFKLQGVGRKSEDGMGFVFQANVLSPWFLINEITPQLENGGRVIWFSSAISTPEYLDEEDFQLVTCRKSYEVSKYEIEMLQKETAQELYKKHSIQQWVVHPGIFKSSAFVPTLNIAMYLGMLLMFYICRLMGSQFHCIWPEVAANAPMWAALRADPEKDDMMAKYGSGTDMFGREKVVKEELNFKTNSSKFYEYIESLRLEWVDRLKDQVIERKWY
ncbi:3-keto-steroid reductase Erg27p [Trichomonascus vanleenenianus]|uniref:3-keto-steroid reductase n=1 Tax=Trichomonascus vanleenenianus TaxID=2268995 RepID=UPI003EC986F9